MSDFIERLNKRLAVLLGVSRREADELIERGKVMVDGETAQLGARIAPDSLVTVEGRPLSNAPKYRYFAFHKPRGYVCSRKQQGDTPTIYSLLPPELHALKPVGRLDRDSSGLLLLTNDGDFAHHMTHPKFVKTKIYHVELDRDLQPLHHQMIADIGVELEDGRSQFGLQKLEGSKKWEVTMHEGRNRQIRRTFSALGYTVTNLHRVQFGTFTIGTLKAGEISELHREVAF